MIHYLNIHVSNILFKQHLSLSFIPFLSNIAFMIIHSNGIIYVNRETNDILFEAETEELLIKLNERSSASNDEISSSLIFRRATLF